MSETSTDANKKDISAENKDNAGTADANKRSNRENINENQIGNENNAQNTGKETADAAAAMQNEKGANADAGQNNPCNQNNQSNQANQNPSNQNDQNAASAKETETPELRKTRDDLNAKVKDLITESKATYSDIEKLRIELRQKKSARDEENKIIKDLKADREKFNELLKAEREKLSAIRSELLTIKKASDTDPKNLEREIERMEWDVQTKHLNSKAEDALWAKINTLRRELKSMAAYVKKKDELKNQRKTVRAIEKQARDVHKQVIDHSELSEKYHTALVAAFESLKKMDDVLPKITKTISDAKNAADEAHKKYIGSKDVSRLQREAKIRVSKKALKEKSDELMTEFKKGKKKLSLDDLMVIQAGGE